MSFKRAPISAISKSLTLAWNAEVRHATCNSFSAVNALMISWTIPSQK